MGWPSILSLGCCWTSPPITRLHWPAPGAMCKKQWDTMEVSASLVLTPQCNLEVVFWCSHIARIFRCTLVRGAFEDSGARVASIHSNILPSFPLMPWLRAMHWRNRNGVFTWTLECPALLVSVIALSSSGRQRAHRCVGLMSR